MTSIQNQIALKLHSIRNYQEGIEKALNEIDLLINPPILKREPKHWYSVEEVAKRLFNWPEERLFEYLNSKGWIHRSKWNGFWLANQAQLDADHLKHGTPMEIPTGEKYSRILISDIGEEELQEMLVKKAS